MTTFRTAGQEPCTCGHIMVGREKTGQFELNPDCPCHGEGTGYYKQIMEGKPEWIRNLYRSSKQDSTG
jgi:hypothetical protein